MAYWLLQTDDNERPDNKLMNMRDPILARQSFHPKSLPELPAMVCYFPCF